MIWPCSKRFALWMFFLCLWGDKSEERELDHWSEIFDFTAGDDFGQKQIILCRPNRSINLVCEHGREMSGPPEMNEHGLTVTHHMREI